MFFTDYSMTPGRSAARWRPRLRHRLGAGALAHPAVAQDPVHRGGDLPKRYYDAMDPFVTLTAAAMATKTLKVGTGVCLVAQRDPIQTAKLVASIDQVSGGRFLFGIGNGWNQDEMENHGTVFATRHKLARERIEAMKAIWTQSKAEYHGEFVELRSDDGVAQAGAEAASAGHRRRRVPLCARRAIRYGDGWMPQVAARGRTSIRSSGTRTSAWSASRPA
jgi:alkanesulfonate monooxygenase SsuD/methylene tetrahydromethanopterin reductase-like flavin-dependent oxidoreductase (luciferase family)